MIQSYAVWIIYVCTCSGRWHACVVSGVTTLLLYTQASLKDLQDTGQVKSHCYSFNPSTQQLKLYWVSPKGHARTVHTVEPVDHRGKHIGGREAPVGGASGDAVMSSPDKHSLEKERQLKAEVASLKEKLHKLTTLKLNEDKVSHTCCSVPVSLYEVLLIDCLEVLHLTCPAFADQNRVKGR